MTRPVHVHRITSGLPSLRPVGPGKPSISEGHSPMVWEVPGWMREAVCAQTDPEAFFPEKGGSTREAKQVCMGCDVRNQCLEYALDRQERFGVWGGLSERERRKLLGPRPPHPRAYDGRCVGCDRQMRPSSVKLEARPDTVPYAAKDRCTRCYRRAAS